MEAKTKDEIIARYTNGETYENISKTLGVSLWHIRRVIQASGLTAPNDKYKKKVKRFVKLYREGVLYGQIAKTLKIAESTLKQWINKYIPYEERRSVVKHHNVVKQIEVTERYAVETLCRVVCLIDTRPEEEEYKHVLENGTVMYFQKIIRELGDENDQNVIAYAENLVKRLNKLQPPTESE